MEVCVPPRLAIVFDTEIGAKEPCRKLLLSFSGAARAGGLVGGALAVAGVWMSRCPPEELACVELVG